MYTHEQILNILGNPKAVGKAIISLLEFYQTSPLEKVEQNYARYCAGWVKSGNVLSNEYLENSKKICFKYLDYLVEIANLNQLEKQKAQNLADSKISIEDYQI